MTSPRTAGAAINGIPVEVGGLTWSATAALVLPPFGAIGGGKLTNTPATVMAQRGSVPYDASTQLPATLHRVSMKADLSVYPPAEDGFAAVGFFNAPKRPVWDGGELWMILRPNGRVLVKCPVGDLYAGPVPEPAYVTGQNHLDL